MPSRTKPRTVKIALVAYRDDGDVLQLVPLGTMARPLPIGRLLERIAERIAAAHVTIGQVLTFPKK
jgi:hypothetical protein